MSRSERGAIRAASQPWVRKTHNSRIIRKLHDGTTDYSNSRPSMRLDVLHVLAVLVGLASVPSGFCWAGGTHLASDGPKRNPPFFTKVLDETSLVRILPVALASDLRLKLRLATFESYY